MIEKETKVTGKKTKIFQQLPWNGKDEEGRVKRKIENEKKEEE